MKMAAIVPSKFAVLSVDDDDQDDEDGLYRKKKLNNKRSIVKSQNTASTKPDINVKKKEKPTITPSRNTKTANKKNKKSARYAKKATECTGDQWEEWKEKDSKFVQDVYEDDLSKALLLSKLEYEKNKDLNGSGEKTNEGSSEKKKKKQSKIMSLNEFNDLILSTNPPIVTQTKPTKTEKSKQHTEFFEEHDKDLKRELTKDSLHEQNKKLDNCSSQEYLTLVSYQASIENKDREITKLKAEIEVLNNQLKIVKTRNTKLCHIIANGEMKDKAQVLMEVDRLQTIKDELSFEVANLHTQLEQERSKVRQLTENKNKDKGRKSH